MSSPRLIETDSPRDNRGHLAAIGADAGRTIDVDGHLDHGVGRKHQAPRQQAVWGDGRQDQGLEAGIDDWPSCGKRVGSRAHWCRDDEPVGAIGRKAMPVDHHFDLDRALADDLLDDDVVERGCRAAWMVDPSRHALESLCGVVGDGSQQGFELIDLKLGEVPDTTDIDTGDRQTVLAGQPRRTKHGAIPTNRKDDVEAFGNLVYEADHI